MKRLTLVRHAHAKVQAAAVPDFARPLSRRGRAEAKATGLRLRAANLEPNLLIASSARRTLQTAEIIARETHIPERHVLPEERLYLASVDALLAVIHATGPRIEHLMVVGHNPGVSALADLLAPQAKLGELVTAATCTMDFEVATWPAVSTGAATNVQSTGGAARFFGLFK